MSLNIDWAQFPHLSEHHREVEEQMAQGLGEQALASLLGCPPGQHVPQLEQFEKFVLGQRMAASEALSHQVVVKSVFLFFLPEQRHAGSKSMVKEQLKEQQQHKRLVPQASQVPRLFA